MDELLNEAMRPVSGAVSGVVFATVPILGGDFPLIVAWLALGGLFFTIYLRFINLRGFGHAIGLVSGRYAREDDPGEISQFRALTTAVSGTVGIGNIANVAIAISVGGPGAVFWLIVAGLLGMSTKFAECAMGVLFRRNNPDGTVSGGPMYYLEVGLGNLGWPNLGRGLGIFYAAMMVVGCLGIGNMFQSNQATAILVFVTGGEASFFADRSWAVGLTLAALVGLVIVGGIRSISSATVRLVPVMAIFYVALALFVISISYDRIPGAIASIFGGIFTPDSVAGGALGAMIMGFRRATFSNEAGLGSSSIAHSAARTPIPVREGFVGLLEPFIDTVVITTLSAMVILSTIYDPSMSAGGVSGIELTTGAFESALSWSGAPLGAAAILFAFSTMISWAYYGLKAFTYLVGEGRLRSMGFNIFFCAFVVVGASVNLGALIDLSDALVFMVAVPNLIGLYIMSPVVKRELNSYWSNLKGAQS